MRVHVHANCQAIPLAGMLKEVLPAWDVTYFEVQGEPILERLDDHCSYIRSADVVLSQPIHTGYRDRKELCTDWIRENARPDATLLVIPSVHFSGHQLGVDPIPLSGLPAFSNLLVPHLLAHGCTPERVEQLMLSEDLFRDTEIETEIRLSLEEAKRRDVADHIDITISPFLEQNCRGRALMHIHNHPFREIMAVIANQVLERLGQAVQVPIEGREYQPNPHVPPLPAVARFLREHVGEGTCIQSDEHVLMPGDRPATQTEYFNRMAERLAEIPSDELVALIAGSWPGVGLLQQLAEQGSSIPGIERWSQN